MLAWLRHKEFDDLNLDDPRTTMAHAELLRRKPLLRDLYRDWYAAFAEAARRAPPGRRVEIGSGGGFLKEVMPDVITSDVVALPGVDMTFSGEALPFESASVGVFFMLNVLHHLPSPAAFLSEASRCLVPGGRILCIEPANTPLSRFIYTRFHHEPFEPDGDWELRREPGAGDTDAGRLSESNQALPWILFVRDRRRFASRFPELAIRRIENHTPLRYLVSGGLSFRTLVPALAYPLVVSVDQWLAPLSAQLGMFMTIELEKIAAAGLPAATA